MGLIGCPKTLVPNYQSPLHIHLRSHLDATQVLAMFIKMTATTFVFCIADEENVGYS